MPKRTVHDELDAAWVPLTHNAPHHGAAVLTISIEDGRRAAEFAQRPLLPDW